MTTVRWDDDALRKAVRQAAAKGLNRVAADCVQDAKANVPVVTGTLDGSIQVWEPAQPGSSGPVQVVWGSADVNYALGVELGDRSLIPTDSARPRAPARGTPRNPGRKGFLRGAADKYYPELAQRIQQEMPR